MIPMPRLFLFILLCSCDSATPTQVVAYVSLDRMFSEPILKEFERRTGIQVILVTDTEANKTTGLAERLILEKDRPVADVFWNSEIMRTIVLKRKGVLARHVTDAPVRDPDGQWSGFAARARVILVNTNLVQEPPRSLEDFARPEWRGRCALARPLFGTTATHVASLFAENPARAEKLLRDLKANDIRIVDGNATARNDVMDGRVAACFTDTDDAHGAILLGKPVKIIYPEPTLLIPNTVALIKGGPNEANARKLIDFITSAEVEQMLARSKSAQIPLRGPHTGIMPDFEKVADALDRSTAFVREVFIR